MDRRRPGAQRPVPTGQLTGVLLRGLRDALRNAPMKKSARTRLMKMGLIRKKPNCYCELTPAGLKELRTASAIEARRAATTEIGVVVDESAGPQDDAQGEQQ